MNGAHPCVQALRTAAGALAARGVMTSATAHRYVRSVTEEEAHHGLLGLADGNGTAVGTSLQRDVLYIDRRFDGLDAGGDEPSLLGRFCDLDDASRDTDAVTQMARLKGHMNSLARAYRP